MYKASDFIKAIPDSSGIISEIARRVGCEWHTAKKWIDNYPTVASEYEDECERVADKAEDVVIRAIEAGDLQTAKWWLARIRGSKFTEINKHEHTGAAGEEIQIEIRLDDELY